MNARRTLQETPSFTWIIVCLVCSLGSLSVVAATTDSAAAPNVPVWLRSAGTNHPTLLDISHAFQTSGRNPPAEHAAILPQGPIIDFAVAVYPNEFRSIDGRKTSPGDLGSAGTTDLRNTTVGYGDGKGTPGGGDRLSPRAISNIVCAQPTPIPNSLNVSGFFFAWGQMMDHDMVLTKVANPAEEFDIPVPQCDPIFDKKCTGTVVLPFQRSNSTTDINGIRQQINANTAFLDASFVYGSDLTRSQVLRAFDGLGHLVTSDGNFMPFNTGNLPNQPNAAVDPAAFFLGGDVRANENLALLAMQTFFVRDHNSWADTLHAADSTLTDDDLYLRARAIVGAEIQLITYRDFLPILLGPNALTPYTGYNQTVDPRVALAFNTAAFRFGHSLLPPVISRLNKKLVSQGDIALGQAIFAPSLLTALGLEPYLRGLAWKPAQELDNQIIDGVRNFQVGGTRPTGFDLAALNIQRGRDNGLPGYNQVRIDYGLTPKASFADVTTNQALQIALTTAYPNGPDDADLWVVGLCEDHINGGMVGETFWTIIKEQMQRTRDGDRFWYEGYLDATTLATVQAETLSSIIKRVDTFINRELPDDAFHVQQ